MQTLLLLRGLPGSGKSTLAELLCQSVLSADMFFEDGDTYNFNPGKLKDAHEWCRNETERALKAGVGVIGVANTFTQEWEMEPYFKLAEKYGARISTVVVENRHGSTNIHNVPEPAISRMRNRFDIKL